MENVGARLATWHTEIRIEDESIRESLGRIMELNPEAWMVFLSSISTALGKAIISDDSNPWTIANYEEAIPAVGLLGSYDVITALEVVLEGGGRGIASTLDRLRNYHWSDDRTKLLLDME